MNPDPKKNLPEALENIARASELAKNVKVDIKLTDWPATVSVLGLGTIFCGTWLLGKYLDRD